MSYSMLSPYVAPRDPSRLKRQNIGDGFIMKAIMEQLKPHECEVILSGREPLTPSDIDRINSTRALVLAGANQLDDHFTVAQGSTLADLERIEVPIVPIGIGVNGEPGKNDAMSDETRQVMLYIHSKLKWSSWRCPLTVDYIARNLPELSEKALLTGCPVMYLGGRHGGSSHLDQAPKRIAVTFTDRDRFWDRESRTIDFINARFPSSDKVFSIHQKMPTRSLRKKLKLLLTGGSDHKRLSDRLLSHAQRRGFELFSSTEVEDYLRLYRECDLHIGSRLHAHLYFLSLRKPSFLTYVDDRMLGFSQMLGFPVCDHDRLGDYMDFDFATCWNNMEAIEPTMTRFVGYVKDELLAG